MARHLSLTLVNRGVSCIARLAEDDAPKTCEYVWQALPKRGALWHAKYASNELYALFPPFEGTPPGLENSTLMPIPGDIVFFQFESGVLHPNTSKGLGLDGFDTFIDLAMFYGRNNFLFNPATGPVPANIFATVVDNLEEFAAAANDVFRNGFAGEELLFERSDRQ